MHCEPDNDDDGCGPGGGAEPEDQEVPHDGFPPSAGSGHQPKPSSCACPSYFHVQKTLAQEYEKMESQLNHKQFELDRLQDKLNCRIDCLKIVDKEVTLTTHRLNKMIEEYFSSRIPSSEGHHPQTKENEADHLKSNRCSSAGGGDDDKVDHDSTTFNVSIQHYSGALLENLTLQHFQRRLEKISSIFGDTLAKITQLEAEKLQCQALTSQVVTLWMESQQSRAPPPSLDIPIQKDSSMFLNSVAMPPPPPSPENPEDVNDGVQPLVPPSPAKSTVSSPNSDSSGIEDNSFEVLSDLEGQVEVEPSSQLPTLINLRIHADPKTPPITVPAYLSTLTSSSSSLPPPSPEFHAWKIYNRPINSNCFHCCCQFKCLTFLGLLNHFRKLQIPKKSGVTSLNQTSPPGSPPPPLIDLEDEVEESRSAQTPPPLPIVASTPTPPPPFIQIVASTPTPPHPFIPIFASTPVPPPPPSSPPSISYSSPPPQSSSFGITASCSLRNNDTPKWSGGGVSKKKKKRYNRDPSKVLFQCNGVTLLPNGKPCTRKFTTISNMRRHKQKYHSLENDYPDWGCTLCGRIFPEEKQLNWHRLTEHILKGKSNDADGRVPCSLCEKVGEKSDKCELMHKPMRKRKLSSPVVVDLVENFVAATKAKKGKEMEDSRKLGAQNGGLNVDGGDKQDVSCQAEGVYISFDGD